MTTGEADLGRLDLGGGDRRLGTELLVRQGRDLEKPRLRRRQPDLMMRAKAVAIITIAAHSRRAVAYLTS